MNLKDLHSRKWRVVKPASLVGVFLLAVFAYTQLVFAATFTAVPDGTVSSTGWTVTPSGSAHTVVDEGISPNTSDLISSGTSGSGGEVAQFNMTSPSSVDSATSVQVFIHARSSPVNSDADTVSIELLVNGNPVGTPGTATMTASYSDYSQTFNGSWNQSDIDSMQVRLTRNALGGGNPNNRDDNVEIANVYATVTYTEASSLSQVGYRWFENADSTTAGSPMADQNASINARIGDQLRLRMLLNVDTVALATSDKLRLQYKWQQSGSCSATGTYRDITRNTPIRYYNNAAPVSGSALGTTGDDPVRSGVTKINQTYVEFNSFTPTTSVSPGQDGMWDFALEVGPRANFSGEYCIRIAKGSGVAITSYDQIPAVSVTAPSERMVGADYRLYENADSATPGTPLAAANTPATLGVSSSDLRMRVAANMEGYWKELHASNGSSCATDGNNDVHCWGLDNVGQLGDGGTNLNRDVPTAVVKTGALSGKSILSMAPGAVHMCALASDDLAYCWGGDGLGQLGNGGTSVDSSTPVAVDTSGVLSGKTILDISAGNNTACVIASDNQAYCWGDDVNGQIGDGGSSVTRQSPVAVDTSGVLSGKTLLSISVGFGHTCAVASDNQAYCWGQDTYGQLGDGGTNTNQQSPVAVNTSGALSGKTILDIQAGNGTTCALASDYQVYCWGFDLDGQLGDGGTNTNQSTPVAVDTSGALSGKTVRSVSLFNAHTCVIASDDQAYCWGINNNSNLGSNGTTNQPTPAAVDATGVLSGKTILSVSAGTNHSCALASDYRAYCWGDDSQGQIGNGAITGTQATAVAVDTATFPVATTVPANRTTMTVQYAEKTAGTCSAQTGFAAISGSSDIRYKDNTSVANGTTISTNADDPIATGSSTAQSYHDDLGVISNPNLITSASRLGLWDVSLSTATAQPGTTYCIRLADEGGASFASYTQLPEFTTNATVLSQANYRWFENADSATPGAPLAAQDTPATIAPETPFRLRQLLGVDSGPLAADKVFNLQYGEKTGTCSTTEYIDFNQANQTSSLFPSVAVNDTSYGVYAWGSPHLVSAVDSNAAGVMPLDEDATNYLRATEFGYSVPSTATVNGIQVVVTGVVYNFGGGAQINARLVKNGSVQAFTASDQLPWMMMGEVALGESNSLWGTSWSPADINSQDFGVVIFADQNVSQPDIAVDGVRIIVHYSVEGVDHILSFDNSSVNSTAALGSASNPSPLSGLVVNQQYTELNSFTTTASTNAGDSALWDFALTSTSDADGKTYCFRVVNENGDPLNGGYDYYPEITFSSGGGGGPTLDQMTRGGGGVINGVKQDYSW